MTIYYFDALAGAGKTRALAHEADRLARRGYKVLFVQPTKHLITRTIADELQPLAPTYPIRAIHGDAPLATDTVVAEAVTHFRAAKPEVGEVLFLTHAAFFRLPHIHRRAAWVLLMDEVPQVDVFEALHLPDTYYLLTEHLVLQPHGPVYGLLAEAAR